MFPSTTLRRLLTLTAAVSLLCACPSGDDDDLPEADSSVAVKDSATATTLKVAAIQYTSFDYILVSGCFDDVCGLSHYVREAAGKGAKLVVTPEYFQGKKGTDPAPARGDTPAKDKRWKEGSAIHDLAALADELNITLVFALTTLDGGKKHNTALAVDGEGKVLARHHKFQLFGTEVSTYTAGASVEQSFFSTPAGLAGLMICADAQCIVTGLTVTADCTSHSVTLTKAYFARKPRLVLFSSFWSVGPSNATWWSLAVQKKVAKDGKVWLVAANTTKGDGKGGGIWKPDGTKLATSEAVKPTVVYGDIPLK